MRETTPAANHLADVAADRKRETAHLEYEGHVLSIGDQVEIHTIDGAKTGVLKRLGDVRELDGPCPQVRETPVIEWETGDYAPVSDVLDGRKAGYCPHTEVSFTSPLLSAERWAVWPSECPECGSRVGGCEQVPDRGVHKH